MIAGTIDGIVWGAEYSASIRGRIITVFSDDTGKHWFYCEHDCCGDYLEYALEADNLKSALIEATNEVKFS